MTALLSGTRQIRDSRVAAAPGVTGRAARSTRGGVRSVKPRSHRDLEVDLRGSRRGGEVVSSRCYRFVTAASSARRRVAAPFRLMARHELHRQSVVHRQDAVGLNAETL